MIYKNKAEANTTTTYVPVDSQDYFANPKKYAEKNQMYQDFGMGKECIPVNSLGDFASQKGEPDILEKTQFNIRRRFGYSDEVDQY